MNSFEIYQDYLAVKKHFTTDYNYALYNGKVNVSVKTFEQRHDRYCFEKLSRHYDPHGLIVSNLLNDQKSYSRTLTSERAEKVYAAWKRRTQNLLVTIKNELNYLDMSFNDNFIVKDNVHPTLLKLYLGKKVSLETLTILCSLTGCGLKWDEQLHNDYVWEPISLITKKYPTFLKYDTAKVKEAIFSHFIENAA